MSDDEPICLPITRKKFVRKDRPLVEMKLTTRVPDKYRVVDLETGDIWEWAGPEPYSWRRAEDITVEMKRKRRRKK